MSENRGKTQETERGIEEVKSEANVCEGERAKEVSMDNTTNMNTE